MPKTLKVSFIGAFRGLCGKNQILIKLDKPTTVREVIHRIIKSLSSDFKQALIDPDLNDPRSNALILVNGKEISVLHGLETEVGNGDEIVLLPISHGG